jgi:arylsulfatase A-like enzyme
MSRAEHQAGGGGGLSRRAILKAASFSAAALSLARRGRAAEAADGAKSVPAARPHIVLFLSDDHGQEFAGCYGNAAIRTPNLDALARDGLRLTHAFAASPTCTPSRSSLYTGLFPARNGAMGNHTDCKPGIKALPAYLRDLGYRVVLANKSDVRPREVFDFELLKATLPTDPAKMRRYRTEGLDPGAVDRFLAAHVRENPGRPLCLILGESSPHVVWERNKTYDPAALPVPPYMVDTPKTRTGLANYYQDITTMDRRLGEVLASLRQHGFADNTLFIYASDQGAEWPHSKWTVYDTGLRVPFIVRWPGRVAPGTTASAMVSLVDVTPTLIEAAGGPSPGGLDGRSFLQVLLGKAQAFRDRIYATHTGDGQMNVFPQRCVRDTRYKYVFNLRPEVTWTTHFTKVAGIADSHKEVWDSWIDKARTDAQAARLVDIIEHHRGEELYDTQADPYELCNLADRPELEPVMGRLRADLRQWMADQGDTGAAGGQK